jgi:hypothetical protein
MNAHPEKPPAAEVASRTPAVERALLSLFLPGLGQFAQDRLFTGAGQLGTVLAYLIAAFSVGGDHALLLALAWNLWSAVDAYRHERLA